MFNNIIIFIFINYITNFLFIPFYVEIKIFKQQSVVPVKL